MTIQRGFFNWSTSGLDYTRPPYDDLLPNVRKLGEFLVGSIGGQVLGWDDNDRNVREGSSISPHAYGSAVDWRYEPGWLPGTAAKPVNRAWVESTLIPWLIDYSYELGIDGIHDYLGDRIWRSGRTSNVADAHTRWWKKQYGAGGGMGEAWARYLHVETTFDARLNAAPITSRGIPMPANIPGGSVPPPPPPPPTSQIPTCKVTSTVRRGDTGAAVECVQKALVRWGQPTIKVDGQFGAQTEQGVKNYQAAKGGLTVDGVADEKTLRALEIWGGGVQRCSVSRELILGSSGDDVKCLQQALVDHGQPTVAVDGRFGPKTEAAVRTFQQYAKLNVDGRAGPKTLGALGIYTQG